MINLNNQFKFCDKTLSLGFIQCIMRTTMNN